MNGLSLASSHPSSRLGYFLVACGAALAVPLALLIEPIFQGRIPLLLFVPVVLAGAIFGGAGPAVLAIVLCLALSTLFLAPPIASGPESWIELGIFIGLGLSMGVAAERLRYDARSAKAHRLHLDSILKTVPEAMVVIDETCRIRSFSSTATRIFGWSEAEAVGRNLTLLMTPPDAAEHGHHMAHYLTTGEKRVIDRERIVTGLRKDGSLLPLKLSVGETQLGSERLFTGFMCDLSDQHAEEERMRALQEAIAHNNRVTSMGQMASILAHELNQPLAAIANYMQGASELLVGSGPQFARTKYALEAASRESLRAGEIVRNLRDFVTRGQGGRQLINLGPVIEDALALALVGEHAIKLTCRISADLPQVYANPVQIQQVIVNLTRNAIRAMARTGQLELKVSTRDRPGDVVVTVADRGVGLSKEQLNNLFAPFQSDNGSGMGLGLSICKAIVEAHGGKITGTNRRGGGAVFAFTLPHAAEAYDAF